jgi:hypothetical protein
MTLIDIGTRVSVMSKIASRVDQIERSLTRHIALYGMTLLRLSVGAVFLGLGFLKFVPRLESGGGFGDQNHPLF